MPEAAAERVDEREGERSASLPGRVRAARGVRRRVASSRAVPPGVGSSLAATLARRAGVAAHVVGRQATREGRGHQGEEEAQAHSGSGKAEADRAVYHGRSSGRVAEPADRRPPATPGALREIVSPRPCRPRCPSAPERCPRQRRIPGGNAPRFRLARPVERLRRGVSGSGTVTAVLSQSQVVPLASTPAPRPSVAARDVLPRVMANGGVHAQLQPSPRRRFSRYHEGERRRPRPGLARGEACVPGLGRRRLGRPHRLIRVRGRQGDVPRGVIQGPEAPGHPPSRRGPAAVARVRGRRVSSRRAGRLRRLAGGRREGAPDRGRHGQEPRRRRIWSTSR